MEEKNKQKEYVRKGRDEERTERKAVQENKKARRQTSDTGNEPVPDDDTYNLVEYVNERQICKNLHGHYTVSP